MKEATLISRWSNLSAVLFVTVLVAFVVINQYAIAGSQVDDVTSKNLCNNTQQQQGPKYEDESRIVMQDDNIYSLRKSVWEKNTTGNTTAWDCMEGAFFKFTAHGCCAPNPYQVNLPALGTIVEQLLEQWRNKRVVFIGDSITQQFIDAFLSSAHVARVTYQAPAKIRRRETLRVTFSDYNTTLLRIGDGNGVSPIHGRDIPGISLAPETTEKFEAAVQDGDIVYLNFGLHLSNVNIQDAAAMFQYARQVLEKEHSRDPTNKRHYYRLTLPQHYVGLDGQHGSDFLRRINDSCVGFGVDTTEHWTASIAREIFRGSKSVKVLDFDSYLEHRGDLHSNFNPNDCSHWCYDLEMWRGVWFLMHQAGR